MCACVQNKYARRHIHIRTHTVRLNKCTHFLGENHFCLIQDTRKKENGKSSKCQASWHFAWQDHRYTLECIIGMASDFLCKIFPYSAYIRHVFSLSVHTSSQISF